MVKEKDYGSRVFDRKVAESELEPLDHDHSEDELAREVKYGMMATKVALWTAAALTLATIVMTN